ncbi:DNA-binding transcriptional activator FeaR [compost metagenome]
MASPSLAPGAFFGKQSHGVSAHGYKVDLRIATLSPEQVHAHSHEDAHFVLALDAGYRSLAHDPLTPKGHAFGPGALVWNPAGVEHRDCFDVAGGRFLSVSFMPPAGARLGDPLRLRGAAEAVARRLIGAAARFATGDEMFVEGLALDLASSVLSPDELDEDPAPDWLWRAQEMIDDLTTQSGLEVGSIAAKVGVHPVSLARRYRRHYRQSPAAAIRQARAARAAALMARGADLAALASDVGYADQSHMTRDFTAIYGLTPARYRALFR